MVIANDSRRRDLFIEGLVAGKTQIQAYIDAGYSGRKGAESAASKLYRKVKKQVEDRLRGLAAEVGITRKRVLEELGVIAFFDSAELAGINSAGDLRYAPEHVRRAIGEVIVTEGERSSGFRVKTHSKLGALKLLAQIMRMIGPEDAPPPQDGNKVFVIYAPPKAATSEQWAQEVSIQPAAALPAP